MRVAEAGVELNMVETVDKSLCKKSVVVFWQIEDVEQRESAKSCLHPSCMSERTAVMDKEGIF